MKRTLIVVMGLLIIVIISASAMVFLNRVDVSDNDRLIGIGGAPPAEEEAPVSGNIVSELDADGNFTIVVESLRASGLIERLSGPGRYTVFAPTDSAFTQVNTDVLYPIITSRDALRALLLHHVIEGEINASPNDGQEFQNAVGRTLTFDDGSVNGSRITDIIEASNGTIYVIEEIIFPQEFENLFTPTTSI